MKSQLRYLGDAGYFIEAITAHLHTGRSLYTSMEFAYGPLLLLPEVWLAKSTHLSPTVAYYITYLTESALGLLLLAWILYELPMGAHLRKWAFVLLALGTITPHLGLNYTFIRFGLPSAVFLYGTARSVAWQSACVLAAGQVLVFLVSPELALAMVPAFLLFSALRTRQSGAKWLWPGVVPMLALATCLSIMGRPYLRLLAQFSRGVLNLPIGPYPHILILLFAAVWLVPTMFGNHVDFRTAEGTRLFCLYVLGLAFLPSALGRCDPLHVFFSGALLMMLSLVAVSVRSAAAQCIWLCTFALMVMWEHRVNEHFFADRTADVLRLSVMPYLSEDSQDGALKIASRLVGSDIADELDPAQDPEVPVDIAALRGITHGAAVVTPLPVSLKLEEELRSARLRATGYYEFGVNILSAQTECRAIEDLNTNAWALLPSPKKRSTHEAETPVNLRDLQGMWLPYRSRNPVPYYRGTLFESNLRQHWYLAKSFGDYTLYRHLPTPETGDGGTEVTGCGQA